MKKTAVTYYDVLGLSPSATDEDVRRSYRALALRWHPDRNPQSRDAANRYCALLNQSYGHLRTAPQRRAYDRYLLSLIQPKALPAPSAQRKPHMLTLVKEIFWPFAPATQEMRHG
ncbi:MAG: J domain-containing protein [Alphaproteobacteria bacterium]|nr:J domain-containing protein [Alphaproteobacteria bacterium]MBU0859714.1 J domain-containing protein [Alphaproteobacteria bacterium]